MKHLIMDFGLSMDGVPEFSKDPVDGYGAGKVAQMMKLARYGKGGGGSPPPPPDPVQSAAAQSTLNKEAARESLQGSLINQYTPYGTLEYKRRGVGEGGTPLFSAYQKLSPTQSQLKTLSDRAGIKFGQTANRQLNSVSNRLSSPLDFGHLGAAPQFNEDYRQDVLGGMRERIRPVFERDLEALQTKLTNQGFGPGTEGWNQAMDDHYRRVNDWDIAADLSSLGQASQMYGLERSGRDADINELAMLRSQPLNELSAMMNLAPVQGPQFVNTPAYNVAAPDRMGAEFAAYQGALNNYNQQQQSNNGFLSGLFDMAGSIGGGFAGSEIGSAAIAGLFSDRRLKKDINRLGVMKNGLPVYEYEYVWGGGRRIGVMADEVKEVMPDAVFNVGGYDAVDYSQVLG